MEDNYTVVEIRADGGPGKNITPRAKEAGGDAKKKKQQ